MGKNCDGKIKKEKKKGHPKEKRRISRENTIGYRGQL
jgi:hypothetical protein